MGAEETVPLASQFQHVEMIHFAYTCTQLAIRDIALCDYYDTGILKVRPTDSDGHYLEALREIMFGESTDSLLGERRKLFLTVASSLGSQSLIWLLPGYMEANHGEIELVLKDICDAVDRVDDTTMIVRRDTTGPMNGWMGWFGIMSDVHAGIGSQSLRLIPEWDRLRYNTDSTDEL
jgi:hypothetical protein